MPKLADAAARRTLQKRLRRAVDLLRDDDLKSARQMLEAILAKWPDQGDALHFLGILAHRSGDSTAAIALLQRAIEVLPAEPGPWNNLGNILVEEQRFDEAEEAYRNCLKVDAAFLPVLSNLATICNKRGNYSQAEALCRNALKANDKFGQAWYNLSVALLGQDRIEEGLRANSQAILLWPKEAQARESVIRALVHLRRLDEAAKLYREWLEVEPDNPVILHLLAACSGSSVPTRASDGYVEAAFDAYAESFDASLTALNYRAPQLVQDALALQLNGDAAELDLADLGCGTGLCGPLVRKWARTLIGCDLSSGMLERAARRNVYDSLVHGELVQFLEQRPRTFDVLLCADTFCYFGDMRAALMAAASALRPNGVLVYTVEALQDDQSSQDFLLQPHGRYAHSRPYLTRLMAEGGFAGPQIRSETLRTEGGKPVMGWLFSARLAVTGN